MIIVIYNNYYNKYGQFACYPFHQLWPICVQECILPATRVLLEPHDLLGGPGENQCFSIFSPDPHRIPEGIHHAAASCIFFDQMVCPEVKRRFSDHVHIMYNRWWCIDDYWWFWCIWWTMYLCICRWYLCMMYPSWKNLMKEVAVKCLGLPESPSYW